MAKPLARISGVAIRPGVSRNARLYTRENIAKLVERASSRIGGGEAPITMRTHHGAGDDSTRIVGRVTRIWQDENGAARYEGEIADAGHGPTIAGLLPTSENDTSAALRGVSIRGRWASPPRRTTTGDGTEVETADDLEIDGLDFTASPGVAGAHAVVVSAQDVPTVPPSPPNSGKSWESSVEHGIVEAAPDAEIIETATAEADPTPAAAVPYADRGDYLPDRLPRFPVDTRENAERAWLALRRDDTARRYTAAQLKRVRGRITKALAEFGVYADPSNSWLVQAPTRAVAEGYLDDDSPGFGGAYRISLTNGPTTVTVCCYQLDPHDLDAVGRAAMSGALSAIKAIDPDLDADIDIRPDPGAESAPAVESDPGPASTEPTTAPAPPEPATPEPSSSEDEPVADEPNTPTAGTAPADTTAGSASEPDRIDRLTDMIGKLITAMAPAAPAAAETSPAAPVAEAASAAPATPAPAPTVPVAETAEQRIERLVQEQVTARVQDLVESGQLGAGRKGLTATAPAGAPQAQGGGDLNEHGLPASWPNKPLHEYSEAEFSRYAFPQLENYVLNGRTPRT